MSYPFEVCCVREKLLGIKRYGYVTSTYEAQRYSHEHPTPPKQMFPLEGRYYVLLCESDKYKTAWLKPMSERYREDGVFDLHRAEGTFEEMYSLWQSYAEML